MSEPIRRELDGCFWLVERNGVKVTRCWTDLTDEERAERSVNRGEEWWASLCMHLTERLRYIGDALDLYCYPEEDGEA